MNEIREKSIRSRSSSNSSINRRSSRRMVLMFAVAFIFLAIQSIEFVQLKITRGNSIYNPTNDDSIICSYRPFETTNPIGYMDLLTLDSGDDQNTKRSSSSKTTKTKTKPKFAYAFVVAGCTPTSTAESSSSCQAYILNAIVASTILKYSNSNSYS